MPERVLAGPIDVEAVVRVLEGGDRKPAAVEERDELRQERRLPRPAPARKPDHTHRMSPLAGGGPKPNRPARAGRSAYTSSRRLLRRGGAAADVRVVGALRLLLLDPQPVVPPRPGEVDLAR